MNPNPDCTTCQGTGLLPHGHPYRDSEAYTYSHGFACPDCAARDAAYRAGYDSGYGAGYRAAQVDFTQDIGWGN